MTPFEERLSNLIEPSLTAMGYELVRVQMNGQVRKTLQIMAERLDMKGMTLNDCEAISETLSAIMDVHDPIKERYALEVSSGGIDRPLSKAKDFARFIGFDAKIDLKEPLNTRKHFTGILHASDATSVTISMEKGALAVLPLDMIHRAKLLLTDKLIDAHLKLQEAEGNVIDQNPISIDTEEPEEL